MHNATHTIRSRSAPAVSAARRDPLWVQWGLTLVAVATISLLIVVPVVSVFWQAFAGGVAAYWNNLVGDRDTLHAIGLTLIVAPVAVAANVVFGVAAAWAIARFRFAGRSILTALIDLPFSVSPVVAGLMLVLLFGMQGGVILCNARAMGEFGAVYVVSGHIAGRTDTMPLRVEKLFQEYNNPGSFAVASLLTLLALVTLVVKVGLERKTQHEVAEAARLVGAGEEVR
jgi:ABC-type sulfate transport system permease subunit